MSENKPEKKIERWIFRGNYLNTSKKVVTEWELLGENDSPTGTKYGFVLKLSRWAVGGIYELEVSRDGDNISMYSTTLRYIKQHYDSDLITTLKAAQLVFEQSERERKFEAKHKVNELPDEWAEIVALYKKVSFFDRDKFEGLVLVKLRKDSQKKGEK